jgi:hypothetical protein
MGLLTTASKFASRFGGEFERGKKVGGFECGR